MHSAQTATLLGATQILFSIVSKILFLIVCPNIFLVQLTNQSPAAPLSTAINVVDAPARVTILMLQALVGCSNGNNPSF